MSLPAFPPNLRVIVRGWLNCNQVLLMDPVRKEGEHVLIDSAYGRDAKKTLDLINGALDGNRLHRIINTHCHSDHMGGNAVLRDAFQCRITIPAGEAEHVLPWNDQSAWCEMTDQFAERFDFDDMIKPGDVFLAGGMTWRAFAAPGHDMDALMYFCADEGTLITGDALWENGMGFVWPTKGPEVNPFIDAALATLNQIDALQPRCIIPGHGVPFSGVAGALDRARGRLLAFAKAPEKNARHVVKVMFVFALLDKQRMAVTDVPAYLAGVPVYRDMNEGYLFCDYNMLAERTLSELVAANAVKIEEGWVTPNMAA